MTNNNEDTEFHLNVDELLSQIAELMGSRTVSSLNSQQFYSLLLLMWGYFEVSIVEAKQGAIGQGGIGTETLAVPKIFQVENGYQIFDYGSYLKTASGKYYGSYTTGRLLITVKAIIELLVKRGAQRVKMDGLDAAKRLASIECERNHIKIVDYKPNIKDQKLKDRLSRLDHLRTYAYSHSAKS